MSKKEGILLDDVRGLKATYYKGAKVNVIGDKFYFGIRFKECIMQGGEVEIINARHIDDGTDCQDEFYLNRDYEIDMRDKIATQALHDIMVHNDLLNEVLELYGNPKRDLPICVSMAALDIANSFLYLIKKK